MKTSEILKQAKARIDTPEKWAPGLGFDEKICSLQALNRVIPNRDCPMTETDTYKYLRRGFDLKPEQDVTTTQDSMEHSDVMAAWGYSYCSS